MLLERQVRKLFASFAISVIQRVVVAEMSSRGRLIKRILRACAEL